MNSRPARRKSRSRSSSHRMASKSRWLVGSSSSSTSGCTTSARASATRFLHAARQRAHQRLAVQADLRERGLDLVLQFQASAGPAPTAACSCAPSARRAPAPWPSANWRDRVVFVQQRARVAHAGGDRVEHRHRPGRTPAPAPRRRSSDRCCHDEAVVQLGRPAMIFSSDDLPVPLRPIRPTRSPASREKSA